MSRASLVHSFARAPGPLLFALAAFGLILSARGARHATLPAFCGADTARLLLALGWHDALELALRSTRRPTVGGLGADAIGDDAAASGRAAHACLAVHPAAPPYAGVGQLRPRLRFRVDDCRTDSIGLALLLQLVAGERALAFAGALLLAILWSASPWQRAALNRGHRLSWFGLFAGPPTATV